MWRGGDVMKEVIEDLLKDFELYHSEFQIKNFIIGGAGNSWMQYKQCLREIASRYENYLQKAERIKTLEGEAAEKKNGRFRFGLKKIKAAAGTARKNRELADHREQYRHLIRELRVFIDEAVRIKRESRFDGLSEKQKSDLEAVSWLEKAKRMAALDLIAFGNFSRPTVDFIFSLPREQRRELLIFLKKENQNKLIDWVIN
jgi:hypothetical protein